MRCQIVGKNIVITDAMRKTVEEKLSKIDKYFIINDEVVAKVLARTYKTTQKVEITINTKMMDFRVEVSSDDFYNAVDLALDKLEGQMRKLKTKLYKRNKEGIGESIAFENFIADEEDENDQMVRTKEVYLAPMDLEEAITRMEALGHSFFLYKDKEDNLVSVVYKRFDGGYGVIQGKE